MPNFCYVYILESLSHPGCHYTGLTDNLQARLSKHNEGGCIHTAKHKPWQIRIARNTPTVARSQVACLIPDGQIQPSRGQVSDLFVRVLVSGQHGVPLEPELDLKPVHEPVILLERVDGLKSRLEQKPAKQKNACCKSDFPGSRCLRAPPYQRQCQGTNRANCKGDKGRAEIPWNARCSQGPDRSVQEFMAVLAFYRGILNVFRTKRALFHDVCFLAACYLAVSMATVRTT